MNESIFKETDEKILKQKLQPISIRPNRGGTTTTTIFIYPNFQIQRLSQNITCFTLFRSASAFESRFS